MNVGEISRVISEERVEGIIVELFANAPDAKIPVSPLCLELHVAEDINHRVSLPLGKCTHCFVQGAQTGIAVPEVMRWVIHLDACLDEHGDGGMRGFEGAAKGIEAPDAAVDAVLLAVVDAAADEGDIQPGKLRQHGVDTAEKSAHGLAIRRQVPYHARLPRESAAKPDTEVVMRSQSTLTSHCAVAKQADHTR